MRTIKPVRKVRKIVRKKRGIKLNRGQATTSVLMILLLVILIFLAFFLGIGNLFSTRPSTSTSQSYSLPSLPPDIEAGMYAMNITPLPETYSPVMCQAAQVNDVMLVIDTSGSMRGEKLDQAKEAAKLFVDLIATNPLSRVGVVEFSRNARLLGTLSSDVSTIKGDIDQLRNDSFTCIQCGVEIASGQFTTSATSISSESASSPPVKKSIVLLSDGRANHINGNRANETTAKQAAINAATLGYSLNTASYYTIAIGEDADELVMSEIASSTNGASFSSSSFDVLANTFAHVATDICTEEY